jgi:pyruvate dehydrogenase E2 component (dihydrolipoamide acetyltransferase)
MAEYIVMPKLGFDMREGVLNGWLKQIGDEIGQGDIIAEIESDKATLELESQASGVLLRQLADAGDVVPVGANLAIVGEAGEDISDLIDQAADQVTGGEETTTTTVDASPIASYDKVAGTTMPAGEFPGGVKATPVARRIAHELGVNLSSVVGTGPDGRIRKADVESFQAAPMASPMAASTAPIGPETTEIPTSRLRQIIGRRMLESKITVPHFYVTNEIDMAAALALRKEINVLFSDDEKITVNDFVVRAAAIALRQFPNLNASYAGEKLVRHNRINIGSAVAVEGGLLTVVQKDTDAASLSQIAADNREMIARARSGKIHADDVTGGTFTVSNLGAFDVDHFIAIINPPDAAILAIGSARKVPVVVDGELAVGTRMKATISADHRVTDGAEAARYMQTFKLMLEEPLRLLL